MSKFKTMTMLFFLAAAPSLVGCKDVTENANATNVQPSGHVNQSASAIQTKSATNKVIVYYFHLTRRCPTCLGIQTTIEKTIQTRFGAESEAGTLTFQAVNLDLPENKHFTKDFNVGFSSMIVVAQKDKKTLKWENCEKVWDQAHNESALAEYVEKQIRSYLKMLGSR